MCYNAKLDEEPLKVGLFTHSKNTITCNGVDKLENITWHMSLFRQFFQVQQQEQITIVEKKLAIIKSKHFTDFLFF